MDPIKLRYRQALALPPDDLVKIVAEKLAQGTTISCRYPQMLYSQVQGVLWAMNEIGTQHPVEQRFDETGGDVA
jgi:hypothetical protein